MSKIIFFTRHKVDDTLAQYQRIKKLMVLFNKAFDQEVILFNTHDDKLSHVKDVSLSRKKIRKYLKTLKGDVDRFVIDTLDPWSINIINRYAIKRNIKVYIDLVEFNDAKEKKYGLLDPSLILNHKVIKRSVKKNMTVIAISNAFVEYFKKRNIKTVHIPNMIDEVDNSSYPKKRIDKRVHFIFAGYPYKKDALDVTMLAMVELNKKYKDSFSFHIAGIEEEAFFAKYKKLKKYRKEIKSFTAFHGYVEREAINSLYLSSDFSIIMRNPSFRTCQFGFPTKFTESLSFARPVIANITSDIDNYLTDGKNGYIVKEFNKESLLEALIKSIKQKDNRKEMFINALDTAKSFFSLNGFIERLKETDVQE